MTHYTAIRNILAMTLLLLVAGCKSEKKITTYSSIYKERPVTLYIAPIQDNSQRKEERYPQDSAYNAERNTAARHLNLTLAKPLNEHGYYVLPPLTSKQIADIEKNSTKELQDGSLLRYAQYYGIDAVVLVTIHRWKESNGTIELFMEYQLRSSKSNIDLMHSWIQAEVNTEFNYKGEQVAYPIDRAAMQDYNVDAATALRCRLIEQVNGYVLRNLPISANKRQFEQDCYLKSHDNYYHCFLNSNNEIDSETISMEAYEEACFVN